MGHVAPTTVISHWSQRIDGMRHSSDAFYSEVESILGTQNLEHVKTERVNLSEGGIFSAKRQYLQVRRGDHVYHVCAAPFGNGFFLSSWLGQVESGFWAWVSELPVIGVLAERFLKPLTYYKIDTALMFQSITHSAVLKVLDDLTNAKGLRALSELERKPVMRDFFSNIGSGA